MRLIIMIRNLLEKFKNLSLLRKIVLILVMLLILFVYLISLLLKPESEISLEEEVKLTPVATQYPTITPHPEIEWSRRSYLMNKIIESYPPINGFSWTDKEKIVYSSPQGIFTLGDNGPLISDEIQFISWSDNGTALYRSDNRWYLFTIGAEGKTKTYTRSFNSPTINPDGTYVVDYNENTLEIVKTTSNESQKHEFDSIISSVAWSGNSEKIIVSLITPQQNSLIILDTNLSKISQSNFKPESVLLSLSANGDWIAIKDNNTLLVYNPKGDKEIKTDLNPNSSIVTKWLSNYDFILLETFNDTSGFQEDRFYRIGTHGGKEYLANSFPVVNRVNNSIGVAINIHKDTILFLENEGGFWLLSLLSEQLPTYTKGGLLYSPLPDKSHIID